MKNPMFAYPKITSFANTEIYKQTSDVQDATVAEIVEHLAKSKKEYLFNAVGTLVPNAKLPNCKNLYQAMIIIMANEILKYSHSFAKKESKDFCEKIINVMKTIDVEYINEQYLKTLVKSSSSDKSKLYKTEQELKDEAEDGCAGGACKI